MKIINKSVLSLGWYNILFNTFLLKIGLTSSGISRKNRGKVIQNALISINMSDKETLEELVKIRKLLEPKPAPTAPEKKTGFWTEFIDFINKYGVVGLAIGFIIGGASKDLVNALVGDILMPIVTFFIPGGGWREATLALGPVVMSIGHFTGVLLDFLIIAVIVFMIMGQLKKTSLK